MIDDGYSSSPLSEGAKYKVLDIETIKEIKDDEEYSYQSIKIIINNKQEIKELREALLNPTLKVFWTFAKDDMHHTLINKYFNEGNPKKIRKIAKYCLKDLQVSKFVIGKVRDHCK